MKHFFNNLTIVLMMTISVRIAVAEPFQVPEGHVLPPSLAQACRDNGFEEVDFSDWWAAGNIERPLAFISGFLPGNPEDSIAFWCEKKGEKKVKYYLVFNIKDQKHEMSLCPNVIEWDRRPRGLTIYGDLASSGQGGFEDLL